MDIATIEKPKNVPTLAGSMVLVELHHHVPTFRRRIKRERLK